MQESIIRLPNQIGVILQSRRKALGITQKALSERLGIGQSRISWLEHHPEAISVEQLLLWCVILEIELSLSERVKNTSSDWEW